MGDLGDRKKQTKRDSINQMASREFGNEDFSAGGYEYAFRELCMEYGRRDEQYLVDGAKLRCDKATSDTVEIDDEGNKIALTPDIEPEEREMTVLRVSDNASFEKNQRMATVKDHVKIEDPENSTGNIKPFMCNCKNKPNEEAADEISRNKEYYEKNGTCCKLMKLNNDWENMIRDTQYHTYSYGAEDKAEEVEGVTMLSMLFCSHGGLITPATSGQILDLGKMEGFKFEEYKFNTYIVKNICFIYPKWNNLVKQFIDAYEKNIDRYMSLSQQSGFPPELIAIIHYRENTPDYLNGTFASDIHNGATLGGNDFDEQALIAIDEKRATIDKYNITADTKDIVSMLCFLEEYNGPGYRRNLHVNPYLYSGTNVYISGKYVTDGDYHDDVIDDQVGAYILLNALLDK